MGLKFFDRFKCKPHHKTEVQLSSDERASWPENINNDLFSHLHTAPVFRMNGFPVYKAKMALAIMSSEAGMVKDILDKNKNCSLEYLALFDYTKKVASEVALALKCQGFSQITVGPIIELAYLPHLTIVFYQTTYDFNVARTGAEALASLGLNFYYMAHPFVGIAAWGHQLSAYYIDNQTNLENTYYKLCDQVSCNVLIGRIKAMITGNNGYFPISNYPEYRHPLLAIKPGDVVIDGGVSEYVKMTIDFAESVTDTGQVWAFEPIPTMQAIASEKLAGYKNVKVLPYGLWDKEESVSFLIDGPGSKAVDGDTGSIKCQMTTIDKVVSQNKLIVNCIKLDIEGSELKALKGAASTIRSQKPNLVICLYHNTQDLFEIPQYIESLGLGYKFYIGHHSPLHWDTVLYATTISHNP